MLGLVWLPASPQFPILDRFTPFLTALRTVPNFPLQPYRMLNDGLHFRKDNRRVEPILHSDPNPKSPPSIIGCTVFTCARAALVMHSRCQNTEWRSHPKHPPPRKVERARNPFLFLTQREESNHQRPPHRSSSLGLGLSTVKLRSDPARHVGPRQVRSYSAEPKDSTRTPRMEILSRKPR